MVLLYINSQYTYKRNISNQQLKRDESAYAATLLSTGSNKIVTVDKCFDKCKLIFV